MGVGPGLGILFSQGHFAVVHGMWTQGLVIHRPLGVSLPGAETGRPNGAVGTATVYRPNLACTAAAHVPGTRASWWLMAMVSGSWLHPKTGPSSLALTWLWLCSGSKLKFRPLSQKVKADLCTQIHMPSSQPDTQSASGGPRGQREAQASGVITLVSSGTRVHFSVAARALGPK